ncbi:PBS lyase HEAT-like repeat protein [Trichuris suis]|nr:PBS lyase HEAT-like repeat protein [Trichuris suis]
MKTDAEVTNAGAQLLNTSLPLKDRFRALFLLRNINGKGSIDWIVKAFNDSSDLLKHELAYCLGQMRNVYALNALIEVLSDENQAAIVRHEAAEAIGAIGDPVGSKVLEKYLRSPIPELAETCELAVQRIAWFNDADRNEDCFLQDRKNAPSQYTQNPLENWLIDLATGELMPYMLINPAPIDPAPSFPCESSLASLKAMEELFLDEEAQLWDRYRAMFSLRNMASESAVSSLAKGLFCQKSALFRHEVAFVLGQLCSPVAVQSLQKVLANTKESGMVRHECAEALGSIATEECKQTLRRFLSDPEPLVSESCEVALDICDYMESSDFQYASTHS